MKTIFYKIINSQNEIIYIGITTRKITTRFREHKCVKHISNCRIEEIYSIEHGEINSLERFREEQIKVQEKEKNLIKEYLDKGCNLINISSGGEWGSHILNQLYKKEFLQKYGSYNNFKIEYNKYKLYKNILLNWYKNRTDSKYKHLLRSWINLKTINPYKKILHNWIKYKNINKYYRLLNNWYFNRTNNRYKKLLNHWVEHKSDNRYKKLLYNWYYHEIKNKYKKILECWIKSRSTNRYKSLLLHWKYHRTKRIIYENNN